MDPQHFLQANTPILDVRSPIEYVKGHIPGAISFPLFDDNERAEIGTLYKKKGKEAAVKLGLKYVGPKLLSFVEKAEAICDGTKMLRLYCARGGMRSSSVAWLLRTGGISCQLLVGGYKAYRNWVLKQFQETYTFIVVGGLTGSGKTDLLHHLKDREVQVVDLEDLASHKGSCFGHLGQKKQPPIEHFENLLAQQLSIMNKSLPIWVEDESRLIGSCVIPKEIWDQMKAGRFVWLNSPKEERLKRLLKTYGEYSSEDLIASTKKLVKRMGAVRNKEAIEAIELNDLTKATEILLEYYDSSYLHCRHKYGQKPPHFTLDSPHSSHIQEILKTQNL